MTAVSKFIQTSPLFSLQYLLNLPLISTVYLHFFGSTFFSHFFLSPVAFFSSFSIFFHFFPSFLYYVNEMNRRVSNTAQWQLWRSEERPEQDGADHGLVRPDSTVSKVHDVVLQPSTPPRGAMVMLLRPGVTSTCGRDREYEPPQWPLRARMQAWHLTLRPPPEIPHFSHIPHPPHILITFISAVFDFLVNSIYFFTTAIMDTSTTSIISNVGRTDLT